MTKKKYIEGGALIRALLKRAEELGLDKRQLAKAISITYPYLIALCNGNRSVQGIQHEKLRRIAEFLNLTFVQVLMLAEIVKPEDFARDQGDDLERTLDQAIRGMRADTTWGRVAPSEDEWEDLSINAKIGLVMMWERVSNQDLIEKAKMIIVVKPNSET